MTLSGRGRQTLQKGRISSPNTRQGRYTGNRMARIQGTLPNWHKTRTITLMYLELDVEIFYTFRDSYGAARLQNIVQLNDFRKEIQEMDSSDFVIARVVGKRGDLKIATKEGLVEELCKYYF